MPVHFQFNQLQPIVNLSVDFLSIVDVVVCHDNAMPPKMCVTSAPCQQLNKKINGKVNSLVWLIKMESTMTHMMKLEVEKQIILAVNLKNVK